MENFLLQLFIFLAASAIAVPIAKKFGFGSILGYLGAGIVIGPFGLSLISDIDQVMHFTEFGIVMMLFLVGLELKPSLLWKMRVPILGVGGSQVVLSSLLLGGVALFFLPWQQALTIGLILSLSSTAIVLQTLKEKGLMNTNSGRSVFSVLLFQDLAVIPILALLPLLAINASSEAVGHSSLFFDINSLPGYMQAIITFLAVFSVYFLAKYLSRPIFRAIAATKTREIFVAAALALVVGISLLMMAVGLSPALGTFLAGVILADSEYRHELESDIEPFKGILLGIFFISIGASLNFTFISEKLLLIAGLTLGLLILKWIILIITSYLFRIKSTDRSIFAIMLAQGGEFAFVLFQVSKTYGVLPVEVIDPLISAVVVSMFLAPLLFLAHDKLSSKNTIEINEKLRNADTITENGHKVIIAGFGRLGTDLGRFLIASGINPVILDNDESNVDMLRKFGFKVYYGDATRLDLLKSAGAEDAELLIVTITDVEKSKDLIKLVKKHYPHLKIAVNAFDITSAHDLMDLNVSKIRRETFGSALELGEDCLKLLGKDPYEVYKLKRIFRKKDEEMTPELYSECRLGGQQSFISTYRKHNMDLEKLMKIDLNSEISKIHEAWVGHDPEE